MKSSKAMVQLTFNSLLAGAHELLIARSAETPGRLSLAIFGCSIEPTVICRYSLRRQHMPCYDCCRALCIISR